MYKVGDKVETPQFTGVVEKVYESGVKVNGKMFPLKDIKPYRTPHEKLIEMGYELFDEDHMGIIYHDKTQYINISKNSKLYWIDVKPSDNYTENVPEVNLELSRILTQYLEELK